ncbi:MAG: hypothetical protein WD206_07590 [Actinomycetota bacterium]
MFKFIAGVLIGLAIGYKLFQRMLSDDPNVVTGPRDTGGSGMLGTQGRRIAERAQIAGLGAIQRARSSIQARLGDPDPTWN